MIYFMNRNAMKTKMLSIVSLCVLMIFGSTSVSFAERNKAGSNPVNPKGNQPVPLAAGCTPTTAQNDLDINNVRTTIMVGGDMWWDLSGPRYEIPKGSAKHSIFAGSLWIGGIDQSGQVKTAAQTYRQTGNDMWGGPIDTVNQNISASRCIAFDKHFIITKQEVVDFVESGGANVTNIIKNWPGNGSAENPTEGKFLAPFQDVNGDESYDYLSGDYPRYLMAGLEFDTATITVGPTSFVNLSCNDYLFGDKTLWWVFNDVGDAHGETGSQPIGMEIRAQAFGFKSNDEINDMTFYKYQIINRSSLSLNGTYFGQWVDPDLGNAVDDFVGCDVPRGLGYCYNGDADDDGAGGYGPNPPAVGVDFFQGPIADVGDGIDNDRDGCTDCTYYIDANHDTTIVPDDVLPELIIMSKFVYYNNVNGTPNGNPNGFTDIYNYLQGIWLDGLPITYGGDGRNPANPNCNFMFPGTTDPSFPGQNWTEVTAGNTPEDRRFLQTAGPFDLKPGAVNYITTGVVWARATAGGPEASVDLMRIVDDKAQALFKNCFKVVDGPDAPDLAIRELDKTILISLENTEAETVEGYFVADPTIPDTADQIFKFQGYQIYQLKNKEVTTADLKNPDRARLLLQCDIRDSISQIVNFYFDPNLNAAVPVEEVKGKNEGIVHTIKVTKDLFATGANDLVNHKTYFYTAVSYAYNQWNKDVLRQPYKAGRNNIRTYTAIPHAPEVEWKGQMLNAEYGDGPQIRRIEGEGNGGVAMDFTGNTVTEILNSGISKNPLYKGAHGPVNVKVYDPTQVIQGDYEVRFNGVTNDSRWYISESKSGIGDSARMTLGTENEQIMKREDPKGALPDYSWGLSMNIHNVTEAGKTGAINNAFLEGTIEYKDNSQRWLNPIKDVDGLSDDNWIRSGKQGTNTAGLPVDYVGEDDDQVYEGVVDGTWAPYKLTAEEPPFGPRLNLPGTHEDYISLSPKGVSRASIASIDLVITSDRSKWTRSPVIETGSITSTTQGGARQFELRKEKSADKDGNLGGDVSVLDSGMSWFPGYAYNLETGERLNIAFGENSSMTSDNGRDMRWNPSTSRTNHGGQHYIYIFGHNGDNPTFDVPAYDQGKSIADQLYAVSKITSPPQQIIRKRNVWKDCMWVSIPVLTSGKQLLASDVTIRLRVARTYRPYAPVDKIKKNATLMANTTYYVSSDSVKYNGVNYGIGQSFTTNTSQLTFDSVQVGLIYYAGTVTLQQPQNGFKPMYRFSTNELAPVRNDELTAKNALDLINIVPNPYYAFSAYEGSTGVLGQLDNRIKIVNLPSRCTVTIFTLNGTLVRKFVRDVDDDNSQGGDISDLKNPNLETAIDWDLKNHKGVTVASGLYLINVNAPGLGERTIKWFGVLRPIDLNTF